MANNAIEFQINVGGNAYTGVAKVSDAFDKLTANVKTSLGFLDKLSRTSLKINMLSDAASKLKTTLDNVIQPGVEFDKSLHELSAIAQVTGKPLDEIGQKARNLAKTFGGEASQYVESFKDVIGSLGDTFSDSTALDMMGKNIGTLSKLMGGDAKAAADALSTAMLQYGVDLSSPIEASREATRMMNVMQAAANVGGSEVSDTAQALRQSGLLAKQSGLSFEELNASLEGLAKGKIVAGEAGTAMRNILLSMSTLGNSSKEVRGGLKKYGVNIDLVTNSSVKFTDRLREMRKIQGDAGLMESVFMKANIAAGQTILNNIDTIDQWTDAVTGTNAAVEGAATVMESYAERQARIRAQFEDLKISIFNATGDFGIWTEVLTSSLIPVAQMIPLLSGIGSVFAWIKGLNIAGTIAKTTRALWQSVTGWWANITSQGTYIGVTVLAIATSHALARAIDGIGKAIYGIPVLGWIAAAISVIIAAVTILWNKCEGFRRVVFGVWESVKTVFYNIGVVIKSLWENAIKPYFMFWWNLAKTIFGAIWDACKWCFDAVKSALQAVGNFFVSVWGWIKDTAAAVLDWIGSAFGSVSSWFNDNLIQPIKGAFSAVWDFISGIFDKIFGKLGMIVEPIKALWNKIFPKDQFKDVSVAYQVGAEKGSESWRKSQADKKEGIASGIEVGDGLLGGSLRTAAAGGTLGAGGVIDSTLSGAGSKAAGDNKIKNINITIDRVIEKFEVHTTHLKESTGRIKDMVAEAIIESINDVNLAF